MSVGIKKLHLLVTRAERTELAPELFEQMAKIEALAKETKTFMERIRRIAQPNKAHRDTTRIVIQDPAANERLQVVHAFRESAEKSGCFHGNPPIVSYMKTAAEAEEDISKYQDTYWRQVQKFSVNELKKFTDITYVEIKQALDDLKKKKVAYDYARDRLRHCPNNEIEQRGQEAMAGQKNFEQQAQVLHGMLCKTPEYQMEIARAIGNFLKAESEFARRTHATLKGIREPWVEPKSNSGSSSGTSKAEPSIVDPSTKVDPSVKAEPSIAAKPESAIAYRPKAGKSPAPAAKSPALQPSVRQKPNDTK